MDVWFDGAGEIDCSIEEVKGALENLGEYYVGIVARMPGLSSVELVKQESDSVTIRTNEGLMRRTNITKRVESDFVAVECDEEYQAGSKLTVTSHFRDEFRSSENGVTHRLVISDLTAPGVLGFFYRRFGSSRMGNAFLASYQAYLERD